MIERIALFVLFLLGFAVIVGHKNVVKKIFGLNIINNAAVILFVLEGAKVGNQAPILTTGAAVAGAAAGSAGGSGGAVAGAVAQMSGEVTPVALAPAAGTVDSACAAIAEASGAGPGAAAGLTGDLAGNVAEGANSLANLGAFSVVDPVPQALMLTAIVIGVCITALALALAFRLYKATGTFDIDEMYRRIHHEP
ncbi:MAG: hypothetical protein GW949_03905 [Spirochaetales bacterium]|nr:hypothetical protein [Spirochaetales bacterium]